MVKLKSSEESRGLEKAQQAYDYTPRRKWEGLVAEEVLILGWSFPQNQRKILSHISRKQYEL